MRKLIFSLFVVAIFCISCGSKSEQQAIISTDFGDITIVLYDHTPNHRDNFIKLVKEKYYDDLLFHRVMSGFMIQGGDPNSKGAAPGVQLGNGGPGYTIPAEIGSPHFRGALAAARTPTGVNPQRESSGSQFYIVQGRNVRDSELDMIENRWGIKYSPEQRALYKQIGGRPDLDMDYSVFGEVVSGIEVIDKIAAVQTAPGDRPVEDVKMRIRLK